MTLAPGQREGVDVKSHILNLILYFDTAPEKCCNLNTTGQ